MTWADGPGVVVLPSGRRVRGRGLRHEAALEVRPDFGVYLLAEPPQAVEWDHRWVRCRDFRSPTDPAHAVSTLREALERSATERVEVGCGGGIGRTGIALAVLAILDGVAPDAAVAWVRSAYHRRAVETPWQRRWVARVGADIG
jgi:protein-tyrosine phosphatase